MKERWPLAVLAAILALAAFAAGIFFSRPPAEHAAQATEPSAATLEQLFTTPFPDLAGREQQLDQWRGKPLVVNFWATWCPPCLQEMPAFSRLQEKHPDVQFVGIAADSLENVRDFVAKNRLAYPLLVAPDGGMALMTALGNMRSGLPFTVTLGTDGKVRHIRLGTLSEAETEAFIAELKPR